MRRALPPLVVLSAVAFSGVVHGLWTNRWARAGAAQEAADRLQDVTLPLGNWEAEPGQLSPRQVALAEIDGHLLRKYVNRRTGSIVSVLLVCGRPGPVSVHTPDVCYRGAGYEQMAAVARYTTAAGPKAEFKVLQLRKQNVAVPLHLRVFYAWGAGGAWAAPEHPRIAFAGRPALYKLYVTRQLSRLDEPLEEDPATDLIKVLLPELQRALFAAS
jgi:hypothetical protein